MNSGVCCKLRSQGFGGAGDGAGEFIAQEYCNQMPPFWDEIQIWRQFGGPKITPR
jgi:hypothetical protein